MNDNVSLDKIIGILRKRIGLIISITFIIMTITAITSIYILNPVYQSVAQILINEKPKEVTQITNQNLQTNLQLVNTYNVIIKSPYILDKVIERLEIDASTTELGNNITVSSASESQVIDITVKDEDPAMAADLANMTVAVFQSEIQNLMNVDNVTILSPAILKDNPAPIAPNSFLNIAIAGVIGGMISIALAFLLAYLDTTIKNEQDIEELLGVPVLALISPLNKKEKVPKDATGFLEEKEA